jgi:hypothetical protein
MTGTIKRRSLGFDVQVAQGILDVSADGIFGSITDRAVRVFQRSKTLKPDGIVGKKTWADLHQHSATKRQRFAADRRRGRLHYNVWLIPQMKDKACWYACGLMVRYWKRQLQQMTTVGEPDPSEIPDAVLLYKHNNVLPWTKIVTYAKLMGLRTTPRGPMSMGPMFIHDLLKHNGPLWLPVEWTGGGGHIVVITGISADGSTVEINDPWPVGTGKRDKKDLLWLNKHVSTAQDRPILWSLGC